MYIEYKENEKHPAKSADISEQHYSFKDAGYILSDYEVVIDIDTLDKQTIEKMLTYFSIKTQTVWTERGCHLYFKKPEVFRASKNVCALGFEIEYKHIKNTKDVTIKRGGKLRQIDNEGVREDLPDIFLPAKKYNNLLGFDEGEGRNDSLYKHRLKVADLKNWKNIIRFINDYIFATPLDDSELDTICRDMKIEVKKNNEFELASYIIGKYKTVKYIDDLYFRTNGTYSRDLDDFKKILFKEFPNTKVNFIEEICNQVTMRSMHYRQDHHFDIKLRNGILRNGEFIEVDYQEFTPYFIDLEYDPDFEDVDIVTDYINHLTNDDDDYKDMLYETLAHCLVVNHEFKRSIARFSIFVGDGGNGKGTLLTIIRKIFGNDNCSSLAPDLMTNENYLTDLRGKLVNLGDDIQNKPINDDQMKMLKNISTCDFVPSRKLYKQSQNVEFTCSLIFTSNHILKSFEKGDSYKRRVMWLPMYSVVKNIDPLFITKLTTEESLTCFIKHIVNAYKRLYKNHKFTQSDIVDDFNRVYHEENNNVVIFISDYTKEDIEGKKPVSIYEDYEIWAEDNGFNISSKKALNEAISKEFQLKVKVKKVNGKSSRVYSDNSEK